MGLRAAGEVAARRAARASLLATVTLLAAATLLAATARADTPRSYVALGDSFTSGPLILPYAGDAPPLCLRSTVNYPSLVARAVQAQSFSDMSCSGAVTEDMTRRQSTNTHAQFDALSAETELVTVGIGFNNAGPNLVLSSCSATGLLDATGHSCRDRFAPGGQDTLAARMHATAEKIDGVLAGIHARAPGARVVVVGYPDMFPSDGRSCWPFVPLSPDDNRFVDSVIVRLDGLLAAAAAAGDAEYADSYAPSVGHDACTAQSARWVEPTVSLATPLHPNARGEAGIAAAVLDTLARPRPAPELTAFAARTPSVRRGRKARFAYSLNRAAPVTFTLQRRLAGRRKGGACVPVMRANRRRKRCLRWSHVLRTLTQEGSIGTNTLVLSPARIRAAGVFRLTATAASVSAPQVAKFRVTRRR